MEDEIVLDLIKIADRLDSQGKTELSEKVDEFIAQAARKKAPLKKMDEKIKHDLLRFIHNAAENLASSVDGLEELFRRLRYFDVADAIKGAGLEDSLKGMKDLRDNMHDATNKMYEACFGKKPSKHDLDNLSKKMKEKKEEQDSSDPFSFAKGYQEPEVSDEDLKEFMGDEGKTEEVKSFEEDGAEKKEV